jgi:hypothetical protein
MLEIRFQNFTLRDPVVLKIHSNFYRRYRHFIFKIWKNVKANNLASSHFLTFILQANINSWYWTFFI